MPKELTPRELLDDLNYFQSLNKPDGRLLTLFLHLYVEHYIHKISIEKRIKEPSVIKKAKKLVEINVINNDIFNSVDLLNDLRNELIHNLRPDINLIERRINDFEVPIESNQKEGNDIINEIKKSTPWAKIQLYSIPVIINLYQILMKLRNEEIKYDMRIHLVEKNGHVSWGFELLGKDTPATKF